MKQEITIRPPNSVVLVMDLAAGVIPATMAGGLIAFTSSCVAVGTLCEADGATSISLSDEPSTDDIEPPIFDGILDTPNRQLSVCSVHNEALITMAVGASKTRLLIWVNHPTEPDRLAILAKQA